MMTATIKLALVDDHKIVRDGLKLMFLSMPHIKLIFEASDTEELLCKLKEHAIDLLILDINLPGKSGLDAACYLKEHFSNINILILSANTDESSICRAIEAGVSGYISKDAGSDEFIKAIKVISEGDQYFGDTVSKIIYESYVRTGWKLEAQNQDHAGGLTDREMEVMRCFAQGMSYKEAADVLFISPRTVETHRVNIMTKLGLKNLADLIRYALKNGIISL